MRVSRWALGSVTTTTVGSSALSTVFNFYYVRVFQGYGLSPSWLDAAETSIVLLNLLQEPGLGILQELACGGLLRNRRRVILFGGPCLVLVFLLPWFPWGPAGHAPLSLIGLHLGLVLFSWNLLWVLTMSAYMGLYTEVSAEPSDRVLLLLPWFPWGPAGHAPLSLIGLHLGLVLFSWNLLWVLTMSAYMGLYTEVSAEPSDRVLLLLPWFPWGPAGHAPLSLIGLHLGLVLFSWNLLWVLTMSAYMGLYTEVSAEPSDRVLLLLPWFPWGPAGHAPLSLIGLHLGLVLFSWNLLWVLTMSAYMGLYTEVSAEPSDRVLLLLPWFPWGPAGHAPLSLIGLHLGLVLFSWNLLWVLTMSAYMGLYTEVSAEPSDRVLLLLPWFPWGPAGHAPLSLIGLHLGLVLFSWNLLWVLTMSAYMGLYTEVSAEPSDRVLLLLPWFPWGPAGHAPLSLIGLHLGLVLFSWNLLWVLTMSAYMGLYTEVSAEPSDRVLLLLPWFPWGPAGHAPLSLIGLHLGLVLFSWNLLWVLTMSAYMGLYTEVSAEPSDRVLLLLPWFPWGPAGHAPLSLIGLHLGLVLFSWNLLWVLTMSAYMGLYTEVSAEPSDRVLLLLPWFPWGPAGHAPLSLIGLHLGLVLFSWNLLWVLTMSAYMGLYTEVSAEPSDRVLLLLPWFPWGPAGHAPLSLIGLHLGLVLFSWNLLWVLTMSAYMGLYTEVSAEPSDRVLLLSMAMGFNLLGRSLVFPIEKASDSLRDFPLFQKLCLGVAAVALASFLLTGLTAPDIVATISLRSTTGWMRVIGYLNFLAIYTELLVPADILPVGSYGLTAFYTLCQLFPLAAVALISQMTKGYRIKNTIQSGYFLAICNSAVALLLKPVFGYIVLIPFLFIEGVLSGFWSMYTIVMAEVIDEDFRVNRRPLPLSTLIYTLMGGLGRSAVGLAPILVTAALNTAGYQDYVAGQKADAGLEPSAGLRSTAFLVATLYPALLAALSLAIFSPYSLPAPLTAPRTPHRLSDASVVSA